MRPHDLVKLPDPERSGHAFRAGKAQPHGVAKTAQRGCAFLGSAIAFAALILTPILVMKLYQLVAAL